MNSIEKNEEIDFARLGRHDVVVGVEVVGKLLVLGAVVVVRAGKAGAVLAKMSHTCLHLFDEAIDVARWKTNGPCRCQKGW